MITCCCGSCLAAVSHTPPPPSPSWCMLEQEGQSRESGCFKPSTWCNGSLWPLPVRDVHLCSITPKPANSLLFKSNWLSVIHLTLDECHNSSNRMPQALSLKRPRVMHSCSYLEVSHVVFNVSLVYGNCPEGTFSYSLNIKRSVRLGPTCVKHIYP